MANVYKVDDTGASTSMTRIRCLCEDKELQCLLDRNLDLLPGDQINPEDPRRWLLVRREMPVPDPTTGTERWSIDFFLVDQDGIPTFVECKRFADTRSRREIVGQVLEYAANGHYYWTADTMRAFAEKSIQTRGITIDQALQSLRPNAEDSTEQFFDRVQMNLREGQIRLVFFLDESPLELRSVVDFLNRQMERSEVLLVEARQYTADNLRIVVPTLFGYTEQARMVKRPVVINPQPAMRRKWDQVSFFEDARNRVDDEVFKILSELYNQFISSGVEIGWGSGAVVGSFSVYDRSICPRSFLTISSTGYLALNFGGLSGSETAELARDRFRKLIEERMGIQVQDVSKYPNYPPARWKEKAPSLASAFNDTIMEFRDSAV